MLFLELHKQYNDNSLGSGDVATWHNGTYMQYSTIVIFTTTCTSGGML